MRRGLGALGPIVEEALLERVPALPNESALRRFAAEGPELRPFLPGPGFGIIAEIKRRSPSGGELRPDLSPAEIALAYQEAGAAAISVLTEETHFGGSVEDLRQVRAATTLPCLRKDFLVDSRQILEARAAGADAVLLIVALLEPRRLEEMLAVTRDLGMAALVEVHDPAELELAVDLGAELIGINNRDLTSLETDLETCFRLAAGAPPGSRLVAESGFREPAQVRRAAGRFRAVLIGEALLRSQDPGSALRDLATAASSPEDAH